MARRTTLRPRTNALCWMTPHVMLTSHTYLTSHACIWVTLMMFTGAQMTGAFYHMTSPSHPCRVTSSENDTVDLICQYQEGFMTSSQGVTRSCMSQKVVWQRADYHLATNISDTTKYGVWEAVPGWKMAAGKRISLLRIRNLQPEDMGLYQCRIQCRGADGRSSIDHHMADICMQQEHSQYSVCGTHSLDNKCSLSYKNGVCDPECDSEENLYDGFDCASEIPECRPSNDENCRRSFANGVCDADCDAASCAWDGGDCINKPLTFANDVIVLTLARWYETSGKVVDVKSLGRSLSLLLHTIVRVMPSDWQGLYHRVQTPGGEASWHRPDRRGYDYMRKIYLKLDNTMCHRRCFSEAEYAAKFIDLALKNKWEPGVPISAIGVLGRTVNRCSLENNTLLHIDLPITAHKESDPNIYSYTYAETEDNPPPTWLLVTATVGAVLIILLVFVIIVIILRIRKLSKEEHQRPQAATAAELDRIQDKCVSHGTDV